MDWFNFKSILIAAIIFIPLERFFAVRSKQKLFRRGWANHLFYLLANGFLIKIGLVGIIVAAAGLSNWLVPASIKVMVSSQPYWLQFAEILVVADLGFLCSTSRLSRRPVALEFSCNTPQH